MSWTDFLAGFIAGMGVGVIFWDLMRREKQRLIERQDRLIRRLLERAALKAEGSLKLEKEPNRMDWRAE